MHINLCKQQDAERRQLKKYVECLALLITIYVTKAKMLDLLITWLGLSWSIGRNVNT